MDGSNEATSVDGAEDSDYEEESGGSSSENEAEREDRISALPDSVIQHIISFLPWTKEAIRTGILSKRWRNQWSRVPILSFHFVSGMDEDKFSRFFDRTLLMHDCSRLKEFHFRYFYNLAIDPQLTSKIWFATRRHVEELVLYLYPLHAKKKLYYNLPDFLGTNDALVILELFSCHFHHDWRPYWPSLEELRLECSSLRLTAIENAVAGCPSLELLELTGPRFENCVIASESLKRLVIMDCGSVAGSSPLAISCPNLEELCIKLSWNSEVGCSLLPYQTVGMALSGCPVLHTLELLDIACSSSDRFVIASESLTKLVLGEFYNTSDFEILCPHLEQANLFYFQPASNSSQHLAMKMLLQLQHVKLLEIGCWFIKYLSALEVESQFALALQCNCLTLDGTNLDNFLSGFMSAIRSSKNLENLVVKFPRYKVVQKGNEVHVQHPTVDLKECRKNFRDSNVTVFDCPVSNLKMLKIVFLCDPDDIHKLLFNFVEFLARNSQVIERIVIILPNGRMSFTIEVSRRLLGIQRCYPHINVELCYTSRY